VITYVDMLVSISVLLWEDHNLYFLNQEEVWIQNASNDLLTYKV
jgi:hypothetical protein